MSEPSNVLRGILRPDGTLELAGRPTLPAGEVEVTIRPAPSEPRPRTLWEVMQHSRAELEASGYDFFRTKEEVDEYIKDLRDWDEARHDEIRGQGDGEGTTLPAGPPGVTSQPEGYGPYLARIRARREAEGFPFRTKEEIDAEVEELRSWGEDSDPAPRPGEGNGTAR